MKTSSTNSYEFLLLHSVETKINWSSVLLEGFEWKITIFLTELEQKLGSLSI